MKKRVVLIIIVLVVVLLFVVGVVMFLCKIKPAKNQNLSLLEGMEQPRENVFLSTDPKYQSLAAKVDYVVASKEFPGSIVIATDDEIIYAAGGDVVEKNGEKASPYTTYQLGSITKTYTATCILKLVEEGRIGLDDPMQQYFPACESISAVTVSQLLQMRSGITDLVNLKEDALNLQEEFKVEVCNKTLDANQMLMYLSDAKLEFEPGTKCVYSNTNYLLLALIIEQVTGMTYHDYLCQTILDPAKLTLTDSGNLDAVTCAYELPVYEYDAMSCQTLLQGAGDISSSALDVIQFDRALYGKKLIHQESLDYMLTMKDGYGCGWMADQQASMLHAYGNHYSEADASTVYHGGRIPGFITFNIVEQMKGERVYIVMLYQVDEEQATESVTYISKRLGAVLNSID